MTTVKRIAIQHPYEGLAEDQSAARIIAACERVGIEAKVIRDSHDIIAYAPDFVLALSYQDPKLTPLPTYCVMTAPNHWYETPRFMRNILTFDGYLTITDNAREWIEDICFGARKINTSIGFYANTASKLPTSKPIDFTKSKLFYVGSNWDGNRHPTLIPALAAKGVLNVSGPENSWTHLKSGFIGQMPFDETSLQEAIRKSGIGLCLDHTDFIADGMPSSRIYETLAAGAIAVCPRSPFYEKWFGDSVLYIDMSLPEAALVEQIIGHLDWVRSNPLEATKKVQEAQQIFDNDLSLDSLIPNLLDTHTKTLSQKGYIGDSDKEDIKVGVIIRAGSRGPEFLQRAINSVASQGYSNASIYLVLWQDPPGLEQVLADSKSLDIKIIHEPTGIRSDCQWAGLRAAKEDGCDLVGILDDDDQYHPNMMGALVSTYKYHKRLSFKTPITMITGGSLVAYDAPQMSLKKFEVENAIPRAETHHIQFFHFGSGGQVNDRAFVSSPCATFFVCDFLDEEVLTNPRLDIVDDWPVWLQLIERGRQIFVPEIVATVHEHQTDRSNYETINKDTVRNHVRIARRMLGRQFSLVENYVPPTWLPTTESPDLNAQIVTIPRNGVLPQSSNPEVPLSAPNTLADGAKIKAFQGYNAIELLCRHPGSAESPTITIKTIHRDFAQKLEWQERDSNGYHLARARFCVTKSEGQSEVVLTCSANLPVVHARLLHLNKLEDLLPCSFTDLSKFRGLYLYGCSTFGSIASEQFKRNKLPLTGVADTYATGQWNNMPIIPGKELPSQVALDEAVVIASQHWQEIAEFLIEHGISSSIYALKNQSYLVQVFEAPQ